MQTKTSVPGFVLSFLIAAIGLACRTQPPFVAPMAEFGPFEAEPKVLSPGSVVEIKFLYTPELNEEQTVSSDGWLSLLLIGDVRAAGMTPRELRATLVELYARQLRDPELRVTVKFFADDYVLVGGLVQEPQTIPATNQLTVLDAVMLAGGPILSQAKLDQIVVVRSVGDQRMGFRADLSGAFEGRPYDPVYLKPRDVVFVPRTRIVEVNEWIDQHVSRLFPFLKLEKEFGSVTVGYDSTFPRF